MDLRLSSVALALFAAALPANARAADTLQDLPFGGRTASMGTAGIARGDDSAMALLNPAGIALIPATTFSVSASLWGLTIADAPHYNADGASISSPQFGALTVPTQGISSSAVHEFPSSVSGMIHFGDSANGDDQVAGISAIVPSALRRRYGEDLSMVNDGFSVRNELSYVLDHSRLYVAPSYAVALSRSVRLGASALFSYAPTTSSWSSAMLTVAQAGGDFWRRVSQASAKGHSLDLGAVLGAQFDLGDAISAGLVFQTPMLHLSGDWVGDEEYTRLDSTGFNEIRRTAVSGDRIDQPPMRIGVGLAYRISKDASIALDGSLYLSRSDDQRYTAHRVSTVVASGMQRSITEEDVTVTLPRRTVANLAAGLEFGLWKDAKLRGGVFTSFSNERPIEHTTVLTKDDVLSTAVDRFGATLGLGMITGPVDSTIGISASIGTGKTVRQPPAAIDDSLEVTDVKVYDAYLFVTGTVDVASAGKAILGE